MQARLIIFAVWAPRFVHAFGRRFRKATPIVFAVFAACVVGCQKYQWSQLHPPVWAVERGRVIHLVQIELHDTSNPFGEWVVKFVELCAQERVEAGPLPCWPAKSALNWDALLKRVHIEMPEYRDKDVLMRAAEKGKRDIAPHELVWILGTDPLVIAFPENALANPRQLSAREQSLASATQATTLPHADESVRSPTTGVYETALASTSPVRIDLRQRYAKFVTDAELNDKARAILVYPSPMNLQMVPVPERLDGPVQYHIKFARFRVPPTLESIMQAMTKTDPLKRLAAEVTDVPVR
jgi:hypothetical protein